MAYLDNQESVNLSMFQDTVWSFISDKITFEPPEMETVIATPPPTEATPIDDTGVEDDFDDYDYGELRRRTSGCVLMILLFQMKRMILMTRERETRRRRGCRHTLRLHRF